MAAGSYIVAQVCLPGRPATNFGVLLFEPASGRLASKLRRDPETVAGPEDAEVLSELADDFDRKIHEMGPRFLEYLEDCASNVVQISERRPVEFRNFEWKLQQLFEEHVRGVVRERARVIPFVTHVPLYSLRAAATRFGEDMEVEPEDWVEAPARLRLTPDMFAIHVVGRSMEPKIPDGARAVFRYRPQGSRQGKAVLVWRRGASESGGAFTIKIYESRKTVAEEGWRHTGIRLKPLNPEFEPIDLEEDGDYVVLGEFVCVLPEE